MLSSPVYAINYSIKIDGIAVPPEVQPELVNNRIMVPIRVISENLGAVVEWSNSEVTITKQKTKIKIKPNDSQAVVNDKSVVMDVKPYLKHNRIFVPLRFIAENFDCKVSYNNSTVTIDTAPLTIAGVKVNVLQYEYRMTMGSVVQELRGNAYHDAVYQMMVESTGAKVDAPVSFSSNPGPDQPGAYYKNGQYDFLDAEGDLIKQVEIYSLYQSFPAETLVGYSEFLLYDATEDQWYELSNTARDAIGQILDTATNNGFLTVISDTVV